MYAHWIPITTNPSIIHYKKMKLLVLSCFVILFIPLSLRAVPLSRSQALMNEDTAVDQVNDKVMMIVSGGDGEEAMRNVDGRVLMEIGDEIVEERMDIESNDYPGSGANNRHDPRTPGRS